MNFLWEQLKDLGGIGTIVTIAAFIGMCAYLRYNGIDLTRGYLVICVAMGALIGFIASKAMAHFFGRRS